MQPGLDALIEAVKHERAVTPPELAGGKGSGSVSVCLAMGAIYNELGKHEHTLAFFGEAARAGGRPVTPAQQAYGHFGKAEALRGLNRIDEAREAYQASLQTWPKGSWQDRSLFEIGTALLDEAGRM